MAERSIWEVANQLGGWVGPDTEKGLADFLIRESDEAAKLAATITTQAQEIERLKGALGEIASEPTVSELCAEFGQDYEGDWQDGYDHCVAIARAAIRKETTNC